MNYLIDLTKEENAEIRQLLEARAKAEKEWRDARNLVRHYGESIIERRKLSGVNISSMTMTYQIACHNLFIAIDNPYDSGEWERVPLPPKADD